MHHKYFGCKQSPSGQCLQLLEAYRNAQGQPRHHVVVSLGDAAIPEADWPRIARLVEQRLRGQAELLNWPTRCLRAIKVRAKALSG